MEEDIKILEEMLKTRKEQKEIIEYTGGYCGNCDSDIKALENAIKTIKAYKEKEYKYNKALSDLAQAERDNKELEEKNKKKSIEIICYQKELENRIPVSLVIEKIEELKSNKEAYIFCKLSSEDIRRTVITNLQELLERS